MLKMKGACEKCHAAVEQTGVAYICSFECTFCEACATGVLGGKCPNCGGELVPRPTRSRAKLAGNPACTQRVYKPQGCAKAE